MTFLRLVERSDVLVENNSAKVLGNLGIGWEVLHARNPRLIVVRMPSIGLEGPYAHYVGFGAHVEALTGFTSLRGYTDLDLSANGTTYHMDPASGTAAAFATLLALRRRERTGIGECIEFAQAENLVHHLGDHVVRRERRRRRAAGRMLGPRASPRRGCTDARAATAGWRSRWTTIRHGGGRCRAMGAPHAPPGRPTSAWPPRRGGAPTTTSGRRVGPVDGGAPPLRGGAVVARPPAWRRARCSKRVTSSPIRTWRRGGFLPAQRLRRRRRVGPAGPPVAPDGPPLQWGPSKRTGADNHYVLREVVGIDDETWTRSMPTGS